MASASLYPPIVDSIAPAFVVGASSYCRLYFSLSKYSVASQIKSIHISVVKQSSGQSVVNKQDSDNRYRTTGIIIVNVDRPTPVEGQKNLYYIDIFNNDVQSGDNIGWCSGWIYKIQIRLSSVAYSGVIGQAAWLNSNSKYFSEWSTYCTTKAISRPRITIPVLNNFDSDIDSGNSNRDKEYNLSTTTLDLSGSYSNEDESETLYSYRLQLYLGEELIEDSDILYSNQYYSPNQFNYVFKTELHNKYEYNLKLSYTTINKYEESYSFKITIEALVTEKTNIEIVSIDNIDTVVTEDPDFIQEFKQDLFSLLNKGEEEDGVIALKLYSDLHVLYNGNICIRRADSKDNFETWQDIKIIVCVNEFINNLPIILDKTAESGVWYKYGVQVINTDGERTLLNEFRAPIKREYEYAFLVGEGGKQLKLKYNNIMNTYTYNYSESKTDTIGGKYPFITRNGNTEYRTFPVNGLISFNMDENELFVTDLEIYKYKDVKDLYNYHIRKDNPNLYDYKREFDFREKVLSFLQDGKPKLLKSSTEGNIIVRLMQVAAQPNQTLNRMIYSFTSTAHEIAEANIDNYIKYNFMEVGNYATSFATYPTGIGQLEMDFKIGDNIVEKIWNKYNYSNKNLAGYKKTLIKIHHVTLEFTDKPLRVYNNATELVLGNNFYYNGNKITVNANHSRVYVFDENISLTQNDSIVIMGGVEDIYDENQNMTNTVHVMVNFLYEISQEPYKERTIKNKITDKGLGQVYNTYAPGTDIYRDVYYKYYYSWPEQYRKLAEIDWSCIEADPGAVFLIKDAEDSQGTEQSFYHEINQTGVLNLDGLGAITDIRYIGKRNSDGTIDTTQNTDVLIDYLYYTTIYVYAEEG